jgi:GGDEF domain-containing protein
MGARAARRREPMACVAVVAAAARADGEKWRREHATEVATYVAHLCRNQTRRSDAVGRIGDSTFAILAPDTTALGATCLIERLRIAADGIPIESGNDRSAIRLRVGLFATPDFADKADGNEFVARALQAVH